MILKIEGNRREQCKLLVQLPMFIALCVSTSLLDRRTRRASRIYTKSIHAYAVMLHASCRVCILYSTVSFCDQEHMQVLLANFVVKEKHY